MGGQLSSPEYMLRSRTDRRQARDPLRHGIHISWVALAASAAAITFILLVVGVVVDHQVDEERQFAGIASNAAAVRDIKATLVSVENNMLTSHINISAQIAELTTAFNAYRLEQAERQPDK